MSIAKLSSANAKIAFSGRPRKEGHRYPGGRLKVERRERGDVRDRGMYHRARDAFDKRYAVLGGEIGRWERDLHIITPTCAETLTWTAQFLGRYYALEGLPKPTAAAAGFEIGHRGISVHAVPAEMARKAAVERQFYNRLRDRIPDGKFWDAIFGLCVENSHVDQSLAPAIERICRDIAVLFGRKHSRGKGKTPTYWRAGE